MMGGMIQTLYNLIRIHFSSPSICINQVWIVLHLFLSCRIIRPKMVSAHGGSEMNSCFIPQAFERRETSCGRKSPGVGSPGI